VEREITPHTVAPIEKILTIRMTKSRPLFGRFLLGFGKITYSLNETLQPSAIKKIPIFTNNGFLNHFYFKMIPLVKG
jgi:hypothetical protein